MGNDPRVITGKENVEFLDGKQPCWALTDCSKYIYPECPAYLHPELPCWEHVITRSDRLLRIKRECKLCKVFKLYCGNPSKLRRP